MRKILVLIVFSVFWLNLSADSCALSGDLTSVSASFYWNYGGDGCWVTNSKFNHIKQVLSDGLRCKMNLKPRTDNNGMGDIIYHSSCGYGSHPNYPSANNVFKVMLYGSDGIPSYRLKIEPSSTAAQRADNMLVNDGYIEACGESQNYEYTYDSLLDSSENGSVVTTEFKTVSGCYTYNLYNTMWNIYFFQNVDKKELRYIFFMGQLIPVYLWIDTETLGTDVYKQFTSYLPKFFDGGADSKSIEEGEKEIQKIIDSHEFEIVPDVLEEGIDKFAINIKVSDDYDKELKDIFLKTGDKDTGNMSIVSTIINESAEFRGFEIERASIDIEKSDFAKMIEKKMILSINGFKADNFKDAWEMIEYILSNKIDEMVVSEKILEKE